MNHLREFRKSLQKPHELRNYKSEQAKKRPHRVLRDSKNWKVVFILGQMRKYKTLNKEVAQAKKLTDSAKTLEPNAKTFKWYDAISRSQLKSR